MTQSELKPQVLQITEEFITSLVKVHREGFSGYMNTRLGDGYIKAFLRWFCTADKSIALMVTDSDKNALGYVVGARFRHWDKQAGKDLFLSAAFGVVSNPWVIFSSDIRKRIILRFARMLGKKSTSELPEPDVPEPSMSLVGICVSQSAKGSCAAVCLIEEFEKRARELEMRSMALEVYANNKRARRFYEKCGWQPFIEPEQEDAPMFYTKNL